MRINAALVSVENILSSWSAKSAAPLQMSNCIIPITIPPGGQSPVAGGVTADGTLFCAGLDAPQPGECICAGPWNAIKFPALSVGVHVSSAGSIFSKEVGSVFVSRAKKDPLPLSSGPTSFNQRLVTNRPIRAQPQVKSAQRRACGPILARFSLKTGHHSGQVNKTA
jgi:hypothetical protein